MGALVNTLAIVRHPFNVNVSGLSVADTGATQDAIQSALTEYFLSRDPFIDGLTVPPRRDRIVRSAIFGVVDDVVSASGGIFTDLQLYFSAQPIEVYSLGEGEKAKLGTITFIG